MCQRLSVGALKDEISPALARGLAGELAIAWPEFPQRRFMAGLAAELGSRELMARVDLLADRLAASLPEGFVDTVAVLWRALDSPTFTGWMTLPCGSFVARRGIGDPMVALPLLAGLTPRWSSEWPVRPFIERHPDITYEHLWRWASDEDEHVRRLVSEGTRPRLPWAPHLRRLIDDPSRNLPLLELLVDDPSAYVRRSVANHLNDIAKDHPALAVDVARSWLGRGDGAAWVVRHGLRTLVKRGDPDALTLLGAHPSAEIVLRDLTVAPTSVSIGNEVVVSFTIELVDGSTADAVVDYRVHYVGVRGVKAPRVFKFTQRRLQPGHPVTLERRHRFADVSIRRLNPGPHVIDVQVNGRVLGSVTLELTDPIVS